MTAVRRARRRLRTSLAALAVALTLVSFAAPALAQREHDEESQLLVDEAKRALGKKQYPRAGELLDKALQLSPRRLDLYVLRASIHGIVGKHDAAVALLEHARRLAPDNAGVLTALGIQLIQVGRPADGVPMLERMVAIDPRRYDAQVVLGHHYVKQHAWTQAAKAFEAYFAHRPRALAGEDSLHRLDQANATLRSGDAKTALALYQQVLANDRRDELARLGVAWATAAISCRQAMPVLDGLADLEAKYAEVSLVRGRCALILGRLDEALARAERYRKAAPDSLQGWILLGDVRIAQSNWEEAEAAYQHAADKAAADPLIALKLGRVERMLGKHASAAERLRSAGPPPQYEDDWTLEYGEALFALRRGEPLRELVTPWLQVHEAHARGAFLLGAALYVLGDPTGALPYLERGAKGGEARATRMLVDVLDTLATAAVKHNDLSEAVRYLDRAVAVGGGARTTRNFGAVLIARGEHERAVTVLEKAALDDAVGVHLLARAYHGAKRWDDARTAYTRAIKLYGKDARAVSAMRDLANAELASGRGEEALAVLDQAVAVTPPSGRNAIETVRLDVARAAAADAMRSGRFAVAVRMLRTVEKLAEGETVVPLRCELALAATGANQRDLAMDLLRGLERAKARCPFVAPADEVGIPILIAWNEDASPSRARKALDRLDAIRRKATGVAEPLLRQAAGDIALRAAAEAYTYGNLKDAASFLAIARNYDRRSTELAHNQAVVDLASGSFESAITALAALTSEFPEARINLGIAWEKKGEPLKALAAWKQAAAAGARFAPLKDWIEVKERFWGTP